MSTKPTTAWAETTPAGTEAISLGDNRLRELKTQLREIFGEDHTFEYTGQDITWGSHRRITFIEQASDQTAVANTNILYTKEVDGKCELHIINEDSNVMQLTSKGDWIGGFAKEVRMWSGLLADIPAGWALCDGTGTLPNLVAKFIRCVSTVATDPGTTGGSDSIDSVNPLHMHTMSAGGAHLHSLPSSDAQSSTSAMRRHATYTSYSTGTNYYGVDIYSPTEGHVHSHITEPIGSGTSIDNMPAYIELAFIARS